jgi:hypothetical protein
MPVSWKSTLIQYAGRLHRLHPGKTEVRIYEYVDREVHLLFQRMFEKRLCGYRAIGYARDDGPLDDDARSCGATGDARTAVTPATPISRKTRRPRSGRRLRKPQPRSVVIFHPLDGHSSPTRRTPRSSIRNAEASPSSSSRSCSSSARCLFVIHSSASSSSNHPALSISGNSRTLPERGGHSIEKVLLLIATGSQWPSTAQAWTHLPPDCFTGLSGRNVPESTADLSLVDNSRV